MDWRNRNSTCLIGDSNTGRLTYGSCKRNTFGELMPGQRFYAPNIEDINPLDCCSYNNVVVMCGINDLKKNNVRSGQDIHAIYEHLKLKFKHIRQFNPRASLFVCPVLPTKDRDLSNRAEYCNELIFNDLLSSDLGVVRVHGFHRLLDDNGLLSQRMSKHTDRHGNRDVLHINDAGTRLVAGLIKTAIFFRLNKGIDRRRGPTSRVNGQLFSTTLVNGPQSPQREGRRSYQV